MKTDGKRPSAPVTVGRGRTPRWDFLKYHGETYDASLELSGWCGADRTAADHTAGDWHAVETVLFDTSVLHAQGGARVRVIDRIPAKEVFVTPKGETVIDFGQAGRRAMS